MFLLSDSTFEGMIPSHIPKARRPGSYALPCGSVAIIVPGSWRGAEKRVISKLEARVLQRESEETKVRNITICQVDRTHKPCYLAAGNAWLAAGGGGMNPRFSASCNRLEEDWPLQDNRHTKFYDRDGVHLSPEGQAEMLSTCEAHMARGEMIINVLHCCFLNVSDSPKRPLSMVAVVHACHAEARTVGEIRQLLREEEANTSVSQGMLGWKWLKDQTRPEQVIKRVSSIWKDAERPLLGCESDKMKEVRDRQRRATTLRKLASGGTNSSS